MAKKKKEFSIDALALKRKLSRNFSKRFTNPDGTINYEKLKAEEKRLGLDKKAVGNDEEKDWGLFRKNAFLNHLDNLSR